ncbi:hypothetical protein [Bradyrhizobium japonicum]|uniref:hypothetical protein n=1 Tax=Bradyrhizobium japonicum TaxID=375 RepID=UPI0027146509|nr:hypothetical protein [Bradyrhizobium japonicum]WLB58294.1 hypothetical protein QIH94_20650 [Bradyrhizobium japonicum]WLB59907.1 hypothetical protein QIH96_25685 [Bradyrhizobium japonicum]
MKVFIERVRRLKPHQASAIWLRNGRSKFRQDSANFVRWEAQRLGPPDGISRDTNDTISPASAGDGDFQS